MKRKNKSEKITICFYGIPITKETLFNALYIFACFVALCILSDAIIIKRNFWVDSSLAFLILSIFLYLYGNGETKAEKDREILNLKQEVKKLESTRESDRHIIDLLEKELEKAQQKQN